MKDALRASRLSMSIVEDCSIVFEEQEQNEVSNPFDADKDVAPQIPNQ